MNTRGGSLYLTSQFSASSVTRIFEAGQASTIKRFTLYPPGAEAIVLGELSARFLRFTTGKMYVGMVVRFSNFSDQQLDTVNQLIEQLPDVTGDEEQLVSRLMRAR